MSDKINPAHYKFAGEYEPIRVIEDWQLGFKAGNAVKYIARAGRKEGASNREDLEKARWYLDRLVQAAIAHEAFRAQRSATLNREWLFARETVAHHWSEISPPIPEVLDAWGLSGRLRDVVSEIAMSRWGSALAHLERYLEELPK